MSNPTTMQEAQSQSAPNGEKRPALGRGLAAIMGENTPMGQTLRAADAIPQLVSILLTVPDAYQDAVISSTLRLVNIHRRETQGESVEEIGEKLYDLARERERRQTKEPKGWFGRRA